MLKVRACDFDAAKLRPRHLKDLMNGSVKPIVNRQSIRFQKQREKVITDGVSLNDASFSFG